MKWTLALAIAGLATWSPLAPAQTPAELGRTAAYLAAFQNSDGGFAPKVGQKSSLGSTSSAIRTLGFVGGSIPDFPGCVAYLESCHDTASGGFASIPGGKVDVGTTASGLMAVGALKLDPKPYADGAIGFLSKNAKSFEEVRIAVAGL